MWISSRGEGDVIRIGGDITIEALRVHSDTVVLVLGSPKETLPSNISVLSDSDESPSVVRVRIAT